MLTIVVVTPMAYALVRIVYQAGGHRAFHAVLRTVFPALLLAIPFTLSGAGGF